MITDDIEQFASRILNAYVIHPEMTRLWDKFDSLRLCNTSTSDHSMSHLEDRDSRNLFLTGLSGTGKTVLAKRYTRNNLGYTLFDNNEEIDIRPVLYVKLPYPFTQLHFYISILKALGTDQLRRDARINYIKERVLYLLKKQRTELIFFDEVNYLMRTKQFDNQSGMELFKDLTNECQVSIVCLGTPQIESLRTMEDEYIRRFGKDSLKKFHECDEKFCNLLKKIEEQIQPPYPMGLGDMETQYPQLLYYYSQGRIGYVHSIIKEAYRLLGVFEKNILMEQAVLTADILRQAKINLFNESDQLIEISN